MDERHAQQLGAVELHQLGERLRSARVARGLTQAELAGESVSAAYVSRIEGGNRRPTLAVLAEFAERLDVPIDRLLYGVSDTQYDEIRLGLDYAELALENGEALEAHRQAQESLARIDAASATEFAGRGHFLLGRALECLDRIDEAVKELDRAVEASVGLSRVDAVIALSRCYRNAGDLALAVEVGEKMRAALPELDLDATDEAVRLTATVAAAYIARGDLVHATRICAEAIERAEELDSPHARSAAYWNASVVHAERGQIREAVQLADRALTLLGEGSDARNLARLRVDLGRLQLHSGHGAVSDVVAQLVRAREDLTATSAGGIDLAASGVALADAHLRSGDADLAIQLAVEIEEMDDPEVVPEQAEAAMVRGQAEMALGHLEEAKAAYRRAADLLAACSDSRFNAQLWFDLSELLGAVGEPEQAHAALHVAARASGLQSRRQHVPTAAPLNR